MLRRDETFTIFKSFILTCRACLSVVKDIVYMYILESWSARGAIGAVNRCIWLRQMQPHTQRQWPSGEARCNHTHIALITTLTQNLRPWPKIPPWPKNVTLTWPKIRPWSKIRPWPNVWPWPRLTLQIKDLYKNSVFIGFSCYTPYYTLR